METRRAMLSRMKLPLASGLLSAAIFACATTGGASSGRYVMRVDRTFDRKAQPNVPNEEPPPESYQPGAPADRWEIAIDGARIVLTPIGNPAPLTGIQRLEGREDKDETGIVGERRFILGNGNLGSNGRFILRGDEAELTIYGSGVPIVLSERGKLVTAR